MHDTRNDTRLIREQDTRGIVTLTLNRPARHNAFDDALIAGLIAQLEQVEADPGIRVLVLRANGKSFSAGADLNWMRRMATHDFEQNQADALQLGQLIQRLDTLSKPVIAVVQGPAFGGGVGLVACCDLVLATSAARFALSEVRLGLIPAVISPYVIKAIGERAARRYFLSAESFDVQEARQLGLVSEVVAADALETRLQTLLDALLSGGPKAQQAAKALVRAVAGRPPDPELIQYTARRIADLRASAEGREGLEAFLDKRRPDWRQEP